jgi:hypothetical protein
MLVSSNEATTCCIVVLHCEQKEDTVAVMHLDGGMLEDPGWLGSILEDMAKV